ncbi:MAG: TolC family protein [Desulfobulbaceae bacterium]|nr:TolC family protein [Desulfobulbaceae bacterium]
MLTTAILFIACQLPRGIATAAVLELAEAEELGVARDLPLQAAALQAARYREQAAGDAQFADPQLIVGYEDGYTMKEYTVGLRQQIPRLNNLDLRRSIGQSLAAGEEYRSHLAARAVLREVRLAWFDLWYRIRAVQVSRHHGAVLGELAAAAEERYAAGSLSQQQLLVLELEQRMQQDRLLAAREREETARAELARLIGDLPAARPLPEELPELPALPSRQELLASLPHHPAVRVVHSRVQAAQEQAELAGQYYSGFMVDLLYRRNDQEEDRLGVMFTVPLPVGPGERQDRRQAAGRLQAEATVLERDNILRTLVGEVDSAFKRFDRLSERLQLYRQSIMPQSRLAAEATATGYQHNTEDFLNVMRAIVMELENELNQAQLQADLAATHAALLYYQESEL